MCEQIIVATAVEVGWPAYRELLKRLDQLHTLRDSSFADSRWLGRSGDRDEWLRLVTIRNGVAVGFLGGRPVTGHISIVGVVRPGGGIGSRLVGAFGGYAFAAGARRLTVTLDGEPGHRFERREFFRRNGFTADGGSSIHFVKPLEQP